MFPSTVAMGARAAGDPRLSLILPPRAGAAQWARRSRSCIVPAARTGFSGEEAAMSAHGRTGTVRNCYALVRPPGHHAVPDRGLGFCIFNNIAVAARYAQRAYGLRRIAIVDWDVHDGNGTHEIFYADPDVLFVSLHQDE